MARNWKEELLDLLLLPELARNSLTIATEDMLLKRLKKDWGESTVDYIRLIDRNLSQILARHIKTGEIPEPVSEDTLLEALKAQED